MSQISDWTEPELYDYVPKNGRTFVDIGAAYGEYSLLLNKGYKKIVSFEPSDRAFLCITGEKYNVALYCYNGTITYYDYSWSNQSSVCFRDTYEHFHCGENPIHIKEVECRTLDSYELEDVDFIKIDVEGAEVPVLAGSMLTVKRERPIIIIENHIYYGEYTIKSMLYPLRYNVEKIKSDRVTEDESDRFYYLVCTPSE